MEIALINNNSLILGPMGFNVRMINSELEDLEIEERISPQSYSDLPIHFSDDQTHLIPIEKVIPNHDPRYHNVGNFTWSIIEENNIPIKVLFTYPISDKTLEEVKELRKQEVSPLRREKENTKISINLNGNAVKISTSREERILLSAKLSASPGPHNFKFDNTWLQITSEELQYVLTQIDIKVQEAFDWELAKLQEIDACTTIDDVYNVVIRENPQLSEQPIEE
jgi:hypothetical protein